jgi:hypothetical protein
VPASFWTNGWLAGLSGVAIAIFLVLQERQDYKSLKKPVWVSPAQARENYGFSADSWTRGVAELKRLGLIEVHRKSVDPNNFDFTRVRNTYVVCKERVSEIAYAEADSESRAETEVDELSNIVKRQRKVRAKGRQGRRRSEVRST